MASKRRFEFVEGTSNKFWEIEVDGPRMSVCFGRVGTAGSAKDKTFGSAAESEREAAKLVAEKTKKGYVEVGAGVSATAAKPAPAAKPTVTAEPAPAAKPATAAKAPKAAKADGAATPAKPIASSPVVQSLLEAIHKKEKWLVSQLQPAASAASLTTLRAMEVPDLLTALYAAHDGTQAEMLGSYQLLSAEDILAQREMMNDLLAKTPEWRGNADREPNWNEKWVPFMADGDGQYYCVDPTGACEQGEPGQVLFYDHEVGPRREFKSVEVFLGLLTALAKKGLLGLIDDDGDKQEKYDDLYAEAKSAGMPKMPAKELKALLAQIENGNIDLTHEQTIARVLPLARKYPAEGGLWQALIQAAQAVGNGPLLVEAANTANRLESREYKHRFSSYLVLGLHRTGRDDEALAALTKAIKSITNVNQSAVAFVPDEAAPAFRRRALDLLLELRPDDVDGLWARAEAATDAADRVQAYEALLRGGEATVERQDAKRKQMGLGTMPPAPRLAGYLSKGKSRLEIARLEMLAAPARLEGLLKLAKKSDKGKNQEVWTATAKCAESLGRWDTLETAGSNVLALSENVYAKRQTCRFLVRALHELGRDDEALKLLREIYDEAGLGYGTEFLEGIPGHEARQVAVLERKPWEAVFEERCFALAAEFAPENPVIWKWLGLVATKPAARKEAFEKLLSVCIESLAMTCTDGTPRFGREFRAELRALKEEAERHLGA